MRYLKLTIAYDGTNYSGFQYQKNAVSIQAVLEKALSKIFKEPTKVVAAGRTDALVHAKGQVVSLGTNALVPVNVLPKALRKQLPPDIAVVKAEEALPHFHARYDAVGKTYKYRIKITTFFDPFLRNYAYQLPTALELATMQQAAALLVGKQDFAAFQSSGSSALTTVRTMTEAYFTKIGTDEIVFTITGDGFLYHMVRNIMGALIRVGQGKLTVEGFAAILASRDRRQAGMAAPPQGLYLESVEYPAFGTLNERGEIIYPKLFRGIRNKE